MAVITEEMTDKRITRRDMLPMSFLKMSSYTGSKKNLRYKLEKTEVEIAAASGEQADKTDGAAQASENADEAKSEPVTKTVLRVYHWTGAFCFDATPKEEITGHDVEFSDEGIDEAIAYLNEVLEKL